MLLGSNLKFPGRMHLQVYARDAKWNLLVSLPAPAVALLQFHLHTVAESHLEPCGPLKCLVITLKIKPTCFHGLKSLHVLASICLSQCSIHSLTNIDQLQGFPSIS